MMQLSFFPIVIRLYYLNYYCFKILLSNSTSDCVLLMCCHLKVMLCYANAVHRGALMMWCNMCCIMLRRVTSLVRYSVLRSVLYATSHHIRECRPITFVLTCLAMSSVAIGCVNVRLRCVIACRYSPVIVHVVITQRLFFVLRMLPKNAKLAI